MFSPSSYPTDSLATTKWKSKRLHLWESEKCLQSVDVEAGEGFSCEGIFLILRADFRQLLFILVLEL